MSLWELKQAMYSAVPWWIPLAAIPLSIAAILICNHIDNRRQSRRTKRP